MGRSGRTTKTFERSRTFDKFKAIVLAGRAVGVHAVLTADRPSAVPSALASSVQRRVLLRQANENDESALGLPHGVLESKSPPGRGYLDGLEIQVAVLGGSVDTAAQAQEVAKQATALRAVGVAEAPKVGRMPEQVRLADLPATLRGEPVIGIGSKDLAPATFAPQGCLIVAGPSKSGVSLATAAMCSALARHNPRTRFLHVGTARSVVPGLIDVDRSVLKAVDVAAVVSEWSSLLEADGCHVLVIEDAPGLAAAGAETAIQELVTACREHGRMVVASGEATALGSSYMLLRTLQVDRSGLVLQPDHMDGDSLLRTSFPRVSRNDFPVGRGILAQPGRQQQVQVGLPG